MVQISIPINPESAQEEYYSFNVQPRSVMVAGSRNLELSRDFCRRVANELHTRGFGFFVGCARGIDKSFRKALAKSKYAERAFVACAFSKRVQRNTDAGLYASCVVPDGVPPKAALVRRTLWMVKRSSLVVLFPDNPETPWFWQTPW